MIFSKQRDSPRGELQPCRRGGKAYCAILRFSSAVLCSRGYTLYIYLYAGDLIRCSFVSSGSEMNQHSPYACKVSAQDRLPAAPSLPPAATTGAAGAALAPRPEPPLLHFPNAPLTALPPVVRSKGFPALSVASQAGETQALRCPQG